MVYAGLAVSGALWWAASLREARDAESARWLLAPLLTLLGLVLLSLGMGMGIIDREGADAAGLRALYDGWLVPGTLGVAAVSGVSAVLAAGKARRGGLALLAAALLATVALRLDARALELLTRLEEGPAVRAWFAERLALTWPLRTPLVALSIALAVGGTAASLPRTRALGGGLAVALLLAVGGMGLSAGWARLHRPAWQALPPALLSRMPVLEVPPHLSSLPLPLSAGGLLVAPSGTRLEVLDPACLAEAQAIAVALPGTERLPPSLRWIGWRAVPLHAKAAAAGDMLVGLAGQVWLQRGPSLSSLGSLAQAPARLAALNREGEAVGVTPDQDWTVGDLAALCAAGGCTIAAAPPLRPRGGAAGLLGGPR